MKCGQGQDPLCYLCFPGTEVGGPSRCTTISANHRIFLQYSLRKNSNKHLLINSYSTHSDPDDRGRNGNVLEKDVFAFVDTFYVGPVFNTDVNLTFNALILKHY